MLEQELLEQISKIKILKENKRLKKQYNNKVIMKKKKNNDNKNLDCFILTVLH